MLLIVALVALVVALVAMSRSSGPRVTHITRRREIDEEERK